MYGGEVKKALFTAMNYLLPKRNVLPMHCSATAGPKGDVALYFGLSGTGKTTLSADPARRLIGDDEHGWSDHGVFNFEGGCYAKVIRLSPVQEPQIFDAIRFGSILENVIIDPVTRAIDWDDDSITENTRATYPVTYIPNAIETGLGGTPRNVFFLACDAYGVLPPISKLTPEMASYHFLSGFTAKVAGTEDGVVEPEPTFSACFGAPFMPRDPVVYADMLARAPSHQPDAVLAGQHRLDGRPVRRRQAHADRRHEGPPHGSARRRPRLRRDGRASGVPRARPAALPRRAPELARPTVDVGRRRRLRRDGGEAGAALQRELRALRRPRVARRRRGRPPRHRLLTLVTGRRPPGALGPPASSLRCLDRTWYVFRMGPGPSQAPRRARRCQGQGAP